MMNACPHCQRELSEHTAEDLCLDAWVATLQGWTEIQVNSSLGYPPDQPHCVCALPDSTTDIAAAFALEESLPEELRERYAWILGRDAGDGVHWIGRWGLIHASAYDRTVAFIAAKEKDDA